MARCPYLEYQSGTGGFFSECEYICKLCYQHMYASDSKGPVKIYAQIYLQAPAE